MVAAAVAAAAAAAAGSRLVSLRWEPGELTGGAQLRPSARRCGGINCSLLEENGRRRRAQTHTSRWRFLLPPACWGRKKLIASRWWEQLRPFIYFSLYLDSLNMLAEKMRKLFLLGWRCWLQAAGTGTWNWSDLIPQTRPVENPISLWTLIKTPNVSDLKRKEDDGCGIQCTWVPRTPNPFPEHIKLLSFQNSTIYLNMFVCCFFLSFKRFSVKHEICETVKISHSFTCQAYEWRCNATTTPPQK